MSTKNDTTRLLDIQELIVLDTEIKEDEVNLKGCRWVVVKNRKQSCYIYGEW